MGFVADLTCYWNIALTVFEILACPHLSRNELNLNYADSPKRTMPLCKENKLYGTLSVRHT